MMKRPALVAHRGQMADYPENTLLAFEAALECGARHIEFDLQRTADGVLVVLHDVDPARVTGVAGDLFEMPFEALETLRVSEPERLRGRAFSEPVPRLEDAVDLLLRHPGVTAFIELKSESVDRFGVAPVCRQLLNEIAPIASRAVVISFHREVVRYISDNSAFKTGYVLRKYDLQHRAFARRLCPDYLIVNYTKLTRGEPLWPGDWEWMLYDITDPESCREYLDQVSLIETRDICRMLRHPLLAEQP